MDVPYIVEIDGLAVSCQSAEAALELIRLHGGGSGASGHHPSARAGSTAGQANNTRWTDQRLAEFYKLIEGKQRKLIDALMEYADGRTDAQLLTLLALPSGSALGGVFSGLWKNAKKVGADPGELYIKKPVMIGDKRGFEYTLSPGFRQASARRAAAVK